MDTLTPSQAYIALLIEYFDESDLLEWARSYRMEHSELSTDSPLLEMLRINRKQNDLVAKVRALMASFVTGVEPRFDVHCKDSQEAAKALFVSRLKQYLSEGCSPWQLCRMVPPIEALYDYPSWLGDMYNACDWIGSGAEPVDCRHLELAVRSHLDGI